MEERLIFFSCIEISKERYYKSEDKGRLATSEELMSGLDASNSLSAFSFIAARFQSLTGRKDYHNF